MVLMLSACANVQHFEREFLADPIMQFSENPLSEAYEERMHRALAQGLPAHRRGVDAVASSDSETEHPFPLQGGRVRLHGCRR